MNVYGDLKRAQVERFTSAQIAGLSPIAGRLVFDTDLNCLVVGDGAAWHLVSVADDTTLEETSTGILRIKDDGVTTAKIVDLNVTNDKLAANAVTSDKILDKTIVAGDIADNTLTSTQIATSAIGNDELAGNAVDASKKAVWTDVTTIGGSATTQNSQYINYINDSAGSSFDQTFTVNKRDSTNQVAYSVYLHLAGGVSDPDVYVYGNDGAQLTLLSSLGTGIITVVSGVSWGSSSTFKIRVTWVDASSTAKVKVYMREIH